MLPAYAELHCRSNFSFLSGASHPEELVIRAQALGYGALALTDECSLAGVVRAHAEARRAGLHLIVGAEMQLTHLAVKGKGDAQPGPRLVLLAMSRRGYGNLSQWVTVARRRAAKGSYLAHPSDVEGRVPHAPYLAGLPGCIALLLPGAAQPFETVFAHAMWLKTWFGVERAFIALELLHHAHDAEHADRLQRVARETGLALVAAGFLARHLRAWARARRVFIIRGRRRHPPREPFTEWELPDRWRAELLDRLSADGWRSCGVTSAWDVEKDGVRLLLATERGENGTANTLVRMIGQSVELPDYITPSSDE